MLRRSQFAGSRGRYSICHGKHPWSCFIGILCADSEPTVSSLVGQQISLT